MPGKTGLDWDGYICYQRIVRVGIISERVAGWLWLVCLLGLLGVWDLGAKVPSSSLNGKTLPPGWAWNLNNNNGTATRFAVDTLNQLSAGPTSPYTNDNNGNLTEQVNYYTYNYTYDDKDRLVSVIFSGISKSDFKYDPFGTTLAQSGTLASANTYRFSKEFPSASSLYYYGFRLYDPNLQRWLNRDPIGEEGGINLYKYLSNYPIGSIDPWGLDDAFDELDKLVPDGSCPATGSQINNPFTDPATGKTLTGTGVLGEMGKGVAQQAVINAVGGVVVRGGSAGVSAAAGKAKGFYGKVLTKKPPWLSKPILNFSQAAKGPSKVLVDSSATTGLKKDPTLGGGIHPGEQPVFSYAPRPEMQNAVTHGNLKGDPLNDLPVLNTQPSLDLRINIRGQLPNRPGRFGDGLIGGQALENNIPLITKDKAIREVIESMGGSVR